MRTLYCLFALVLTVVGLAGSAVANQNVAKPPKWAPIYSYKHHSSKAFIDTNSIIKKENEKGQYNSAGILIVYNTPVQVIIGGETKLVKSILKYQVLECNSGMIAPVSDFYFSNAMPTDKDTPVGIFIYNDLQGAGTVSKSSLTYSILCPTYI